MQIYTIVIGGLEKSYMQKLVLYLNERLGKSARVELLEHWEIPEQPEVWLSLIHISEPTRRTPISYAVFCLKKKKNSERKKKKR